MRNVFILLFLALLNVCTGPDKSKPEKERPIMEKYTVGPDNPVEQKEGLVYFSGNNGGSCENRSEGLPDSATIIRATSESS